MESIMSALLPRKLPLLLLASSLLFAPACGGEPEEEEISPLLRCEEEGLKAYLVGTIQTEDGPHDFLIRSPEEAPGFIGFNEIRVVVGSFSPPGSSTPLPVILRIYENDGRQNLIHRLSELTDDGPLSLQVADASLPRDGSQGRTNLDTYDCSLENGTFCLQIGFDSVGDQTLQDQDEFAYNGASGSLDIEIADRRVKVSFDLDLGPNVLGFQDQSTGSLQGCIAPRYSVSPDDNWPLALTAPTAVAIN